MYELSIFQIVDISHSERVIVLEDKELLSVKVVEPYAIMLAYENGTAEKKNFLN